MSLTGRTAIITGGERGIGRGIVEEFLKRGMRVCIAGIDEESAKETIQFVNADERVMFVKTDVTQETEVLDAVKQTVERFGRLDALVANAGLAKASGQEVETLELEKWNRILATNLTGVFLCAKHAFPELRKTKGSMVLIASTRALQSQKNGIAYSASKGGVVALGHSLAISGGPDIRVNVISPGWICVDDPEKLRPESHQVHPVGRVGKPSDIAGMAAYLVSDEAGFITGQNFPVDGGMTRKMIYT